MERVRGSKLLRHERHATDTSVASLAAENARRAGQAMGRFGLLIRLATLTYARWQRRNSRAIEAPIPPCADDQEITAPAGHYFLSLPRTHTRT